MYEQMIREAMAHLGRVGEQHPAIVEAWMRVEHGTLDHLSADAFRRDVAVALDCARELSHDLNVEVARSFGFKVSA